MISGGHSPETKGQPGAIRAALFGMCPRCFERTLFSLPTRVADQCSNCGLEFTQYERGSRFAGVLTAIVAILLMVAAILIDDWLRPPLLIFLVALVPVTLGCVLGVLRVFKSVLLYASYERAKEKKIEE